MRKYILLFCISLSAVVACAQLSITGNHVLLGKKNGKDSITVIIFDNLKLNNSISYNGTNVRFYKFVDANSKTNPIYPTLDPEDATGYVIDVDGVRKDTIWVIDYQLYKPISIEPEVSPTTQCQNLNLLFTIPPMSYKSLTGTSYDLERDFTIKYKQLSWQSTAWATVDTTKTVKTPATQISVPVPYCNTIFKLLGDQYATDLGITDTISSSLYTTNAVISHLTTNVTSRDQGQGYNNEADYPQSNKLPINFSAPIDVQFLSNANEPTTQYYSWNIYKDNNFIINRKDKDERYTFTDAGTYNVKLTVSNSICSYSDSVKVIVTESEIYVPNVFTPNGDGFNDEFRIAYKSLISFQCWVYNRWGRQVYYWTDPTKGWDGTINGKKATVGAYFYVINAVGSDKKVYKLKGDINLLR
jgi:gliding motility-associated-like protein